MWAQTGWWVHLTSTEYKSEATHNHGSPVKWSAHVCTPWKGLLAWGRARGRSRTGEGQPRTRCPLQSSQQECCQFPRPARALPAAAAGPGHAGARAAQTSFLLTSLKKNSLCSSWPNIKCHFHTNFRAWAQVFVFQSLCLLHRWVQPRSREQSTRTDETWFSSLWNYFICDFSEYKRLQLKLGIMKAEVDFQLKKKPNPECCNYFCHTKSLLKAFLYSEINIQVKYLTSLIHFLQGLFYWVFFPS